MSVTLLQPFGLFALGALLVPIVLHLARRSEHHVIDFAALRWLTARARPRRRVRVIERGLLALRLLLITALALLLAEPILVGSESSRAWTLIAPGVDPASIPALEVDVDDDARATWRWLAPGFPGLDSPRPVTQVRVSSLLRELDARLPTSTALTVWVPREMAGLDGARMELKRKVAWRIVRGRAPSAPPRKAAPIELAVRFSPDRNDALRYLRAASQAWLIETVDRKSARSSRTANAAQSGLSDVAASAAPPQSGSAALVWLRPGELPPAVRAWTGGGGTLLIEPRTPWRMRADTSVIVWRGADGAPLARAMRVGRGRVVRLEVPLVASELPALLDNSFARVLREILDPHEMQPDRALARDVAPVVKRSQDTYSQTFAESGRALAPWLALLIAALGVIERVVATSAQRWRSA